MARTAARSSRTFGRANSRVDSFEIISAAPVHPVSRVAGLLIRLRAELFVAVVFLVVWFELRAHLSLTWTITVLAVSTAVVGGVPQTRRFVIRRAMAVLTRHRLRQTLVECRVVNFSRACPVFLWSRPNQVGETVWLFLRAGIAPSDIEGQTEWIAAGCNAREARITITRSMTAIVRVEVIRRDPLADDLIGSDLAPWADDAAAPAGPRTLYAVPYAGPGPTTNRQATTAPPPIVVDSEAGTTSNGTPASDDARNTRAKDTRPPQRGGDWSDYV